MELIKSDDGKYIAVEQDDGNFVIYLADENGNPLTALWDKWSYEAVNGIPYGVNN